MKPYHILLLSVILLSCSSKGIQPSPHQVVVSDHISNQRVTAFAEDADGFLWMGTGRGLNRYDGTRYHQYFTSPSDSASLPSNVISSLYADSKGRLWVGTDRGACLYDKSEDCFRRVSCDAPIKLVHQIWETPDGRILFNHISQLCAYNTQSNCSEVVIRQFDPAGAFVNDCFPSPDGTFWSVCNGHLRHYDSLTLELLEDIPTKDSYEYACLLSGGELWLTTQNGTAVFDTGSKSYIPFPLPLQNHPAFGGCYVSLMQEFSDGGLFLNTDRGVFIYSQKDEAVIHEGEAAFPADIPTDDFCCTFIDSRHDMWIGTQNHGFTNISRENSAFNQDRVLVRAINGHSVTSLAVLSDGDLLVSTSSNRLFRYHSSTASIVELDRSRIANRKLPNDPPASLFADNSGRLWLLQNEMLREIRMAGQHVEQIRTCTEIRQKVSCMAESQDGTLWVGVIGNALYRLRPGEDRFSSVTIDSKTVVAPSCILPLPDGDLLLGMMLSSPLLVRPDSGEAQELPDWKKVSKDNFVTQMALDSSGKVWIATRSDGILRWDYGNNVLEKIGGLSCNETSSIICDRNGDIWIASLAGLNRRIKESGTILSFSDSGELGEGQFNSGAAVSLQDGTLAFGGTHGITLYNPSFIPEYKEIPLYFEDLTVGKNRFSLMEASSVRLTHKDNHFAISFAALDFSGNNRPHYYYRLRGLQKDWTDNGHNPEVAFSNLAPGHYTLEVRTSPEDMRQSPSSAALPIRVISAPWNSWWARILYVLALAGILFAFYRNRIRILREHEAAKRATLEKEQERKVNEMNMSFFANISHEFRTPLTLISGPVTQLEKTDADPKLLNTLKWNVARMLRLVNQLMDFGKLEEDTLKLQVADADVIGLLRQTAGGFAYNMEEKDITFLPSGYEDSFLCPVDADKLDKIVSNLLSNAMKYTPAGGKVGGGFDVIPWEEAKTLWTDAPQCRYMKVTVSDNGPMIPEASLERIFERYYQVENHHNYGTGLGLYFARRLAVLHHGWLRCDNLPEEGLVFTLLLPAEDIYSPEEKTTSPQQQPLFVPSEGALEARAPQKFERTVQVVDDDPGIVGYLRDLLGGTYNVLTAFDASSALELAKNEVPDLIVSDVAMPKMDGYEFCRLIKEDASTCHIPVILVTAKTTLENQIEGIRTGADAYITKPFAPEYLKAVIETQLANRERVRRLLSGATQMEDIAEEAALSPQDSALMKELYSLMEEELSNQELNINAITERLYISRSKFYYKIKALTGDNPNAFFKKYKLNRAVELLRSGKYNVNEVADMTGWSSSTVFGRNFKAQFGETPTEFLSK